MEEEEEEEERFPLADHNVGDVGSRTAVAQFKAVTLTAQPHHHAWQWSGVFLHLRHLTKAEEQ